MTFVNAFDSQNFSVNGRVRNTQLGIGNIILTVDLEITMDLGILQKILC